MLNHVRKILLINPDSRPIYEGSVVEDVSPSYPPLNLALIAAVLLQNKYNVKVLDLNIENDQNAFWSFYFRPSFVVRRILKGIKNNTIFDDLKVFVKTEW